MQKFNVVVDGSHKAEVAIDVVGATFTGTVVSPDYGTGVITSGKVDGAALTGIVSLDGYDANFSATITGTAISGSLKYGWFFDKPFSGTVAEA